MRSTILARNKSSFAPFHYSSLRGKKWNSGSDAMRPITSFDELMRKWISRRAAMRRLQKQEIITPSCLSLSLRNCTLKEGAGLQLGTWCDSSPLSIIIHETMKMMMMMILDRLRSRDWVNRSPTLADGLQTIIILCDVITRIGLEEEEEEICTWIRSAFKFF